MDRKKELKQKYKLMKPDMGIFLIESKSSNKCFLQTTQDLRGVLNGTQVKLKMGFHPNRELQQEWSALGPENFRIEILERLEYDKDETKTDYTEDLALMKMYWEEKLTAENKEFYRKRL